MEGISIIGIFSESFWYMAPILMSLTVSITGVINGKFNITTGIWPQIVSWVVGALLSAGAWFFNFVSLGEPTWLSLIALMAVVGLSSNGVYDIPAIKKFIDSWFNREKLVKSE
jgi:hypothetical protein